MADTHSLLPGKPLHRFSVKHGQTNLFKVIAGVDAGFDLALRVELQQLEHGPGDEFLVGQVAQVEATHGLVGLHQFQGVKGELVVPGLSHGQQVLLLASHTIGSTWNKGE